MLITETKLDSSIFSSELLPKGYVGEFRGDRNLNGGGDAERGYVNGILQNGLESGNNKPFWK